MDERDYYRDQTIKALRHLHPQAAERAQAYAALYVGDQVARIAELLGEEKAAEVKIRPGDNGRLHCRSRWRDRDGVIAVCDMPKDHGPQHFGWCSGLRVTWQESDAENPTRPAVIGEPLSVACPHCGAEVGMPCMERIRGELVIVNHGERIERARQA